MIHIFEQYPLLKERIPYVQLGEFPTPIKHLRHLGKEIGTDYLYLKHDGLSGLRGRKRSLLLALLDQTTPSLQRSMRRNLV